MKRRDFLKSFVATGFILFLDKKDLFDPWSWKEKRSGFPLGMVLIDPHAHPDLFSCTPQYCDQTSTVEKITAIKMNACGFAAVGDGVSGGNAVGFSFEQLLNQLQIAVNFDDIGKINLIRKATDVPFAILSPFFIPGGILSVEGATPLGTDLSKLEDLYRLGVRMITPMHRMVNEIGDIMTAPAFHGGLTFFGKLFVERLMSLGIIADAAHAHFNTLRDMIEIARINGFPIIDSHTSLTLRKDPYGTTRLRTFEEMELIASTDGVVCTWPLAWESESYRRKTFWDWAEENLEIAHRIGFDHIGLGTDGGGGLPNLIEGYQSILALPQLVKAMFEVGFKRREIAAYMGGNLLRVLKKVLA